MDWYNKVKNFLTNRGMKKNMQDLIYIFIIGLIIVIAASFFATPQSKKTAGYIDSGTVNNTNNTANLSYGDKMKAELTDVLGKIEGAGKVSVMITFEGSDEVIPAYSQNNSTKVTEENDGSGGKRVTNENTSSTTVVTTNEGGNTKPFITKEVNPKISGIIVIAEGAGNPDVKYKLYEAVKTVFNLQQYKVNIYAMEKNK